MLENSSRCSHHHHHRACIHRRAFSLLRPLPALPLKISSRYSTCICFSSSIFSTHMHVCTSHLNTQSMCCARGLLNLFFFSFLNKWPHLFKVPEPGVEGRARATTEAMISSYIVSHTGSPIESFLRRYLINEVVNQSRGRSFLIPTVPTILFRSRKEFKNHH